MGSIKLLQRDACHIIRLSLEPRLIGVSGNAYAIEVSQASIEFEHSAMSPWSPYRLTRRTYGKRKTEGKRRTDTKEEIML